MVQMLTKLKPLGRPKAPRKTPELNNTTIRDFGGGLNVVDSEQNLTSKFAPVFDNMVTYTDRRASPRYGYEMWVKLKAGTETSGTANITITTNHVGVVEPYVLIINWTDHPFTGTGAKWEHVTISGWDITYNGVTPEMMNRTHGIREVIDANQFSINIYNSVTATGTSPVESINWMRDDHLLGGVPVECKYFDNYIILWTSAGEILRIDRFRTAQRIWSAAIAFSLENSPTGWSYTDFVASDIFGTELVCSNGKNKPLKIDFTQPEGEWVRYLTDAAPDGTTHIPPFDACKSAFRFFTIHDTELASFPEFLTSIRIAAKDTSVVYSSATNPSDAIDIDMSKIIASPEQTVRGFATIKDALLVITPTATTLMKLGTMAPVFGSTTGEEVHDPQPIDTLNGFGSNAPRTIVEIGSDVFMIDFNGVPSAKLSTVSNAVVPERVSNYIESMMSKHIGRMRKETMRLKAFGFYDGKNKSVHFYMPKFDDNDTRDLTTDPFYFDSDMSQHEFTKRSLIMRHDDHQIEAGDHIVIADAMSFGGVAAADINGERTVLSVLNDNYLLVSIGADLPLAVDMGGGGTSTKITPCVDGTVGYIYHYVPQLKLFAWSRFKTPLGMMFNCGCGTVEGRSFLFTPDGHMMRYGSPDHHVHADWFGMYDHALWTSGQTYTAGARVYDTIDGLVYKCLADVTTTAPDFAHAREIAPDSWEEYKGEPISFDWELPWADFGARQATKALRFVHMDATGTAQFTVDLFADNIYKDAATGQYTPARSMTFVPNDVGAFGAGQQVYGAGRRTREQKLWTMPVRFKTMKVRIHGESTEPVSFSAISLMYQKGSMVRG